MESNMHISGSIVAIVTPFFEDGSIDYKTYEKLIEWHIQEGTNAIVAVGTTGESATVTPEEHCQLISVAINAAAGRVPIIAGTGGNSTQEAIELTEFAKKAGASASLQVVPYYNRPTQEGMFAHFRKIAESVDLPVILYNVPSRTVADITNETVCRLAKIPGIKAIKDATADMHRGAWLLKMLREQGNPDFMVYSGDDATAMAYMFLGAKGNISVTANVAPKQMAQLCKFATNGEIQKAIIINNELLPLHKNLFIEPNPVPVKWALERMGKIDGCLRLPLVPLSQSYTNVVEAALVAAKVL
jgi:4-hydroxy-tetrahydrodipicolinate synthase